MPSIVKHAARSSTRSGGVRWSVSVERCIAELTAEHGDRWFTVPEAVAYDMADGVIGGPAGAPESGTPA